MNIDRLNILVVDGELDHRILAKCILNSHRHRVDLASNGVDGLNMYTQKKYDMIFVDIKMPYYGGLHFVQKLRLEEKNFNLPIIAWTAISDEIQPIELKYLGFDDLLYKPMNNQCMIDIVDKWCSSIRQCA